MYLGQKLEVYFTFGQWALVKLDGLTAQIGLVPQSYIKILSGPEKVRFIESWLI